MATFVPCNIGDRRITLLNSDRQNNAIAIKNLAKESQDNAPAWYQKQMETYGNQIPITPTPSLGQLITADTDARSSNLALSRNDLVQKLLSISSQEIAQYVIGRIPDSAVQILNMVWTGILHDLKKTYSVKGLSKENLVVFLMKLNNI